MNPPTRSSHFSEAEKISRLRLIRSENIGPVTFQKLLDRFGTAAHALDALPELARNGGRKRPINVCSLNEAEREWGQALDQGVTLRFLGEPEYPPLLSHIADPPPVLFVRGHDYLLRKRAIGIVGSRNASANGRQLARTIAERLGQAGYLVVSGMARGIDAAAHEGAMATGTVAVLGGGVDIVYPREHGPLYDELVTSGAVCSEMPLGTKPQARHFPRRNRIISGISRGIVVLEAGAKSGSLITARMALEQGREVFAVPGSPQDPRVKGANTLIREGAQLTEHADDVISVLRDMEGRHVADPPPPPFAPAQFERVDVSEIRKARPDVITALGFEPISIDEIVRVTGIGPSIVSTVLLELELAGRLERLPGSKVSLIGNDDA